MITTKEQVIRALLQQVAEFIPLPEATVATLGGNGVEARVWMEFGIQAEHGWLIERSRATAQKLIRQYPFEVLQGSLKRFPSVLSGKCLQPQLDLFHWDLAGTVESSIQELELVLPFLLASRGRLLAVTYFDSRRNLSLEEPRVMRLAEKLFGSQFSRLWDSLLELYSREPEPGQLPAFFHPRDAKARARNTAVREVGALTHLLLALSSLPELQQKGLETPLSVFLRYCKDEVELRHVQRALERAQLPSGLSLVSRTLYISRYGKSHSPMRMRSFVFRLDPLGPFPLKEYAASQVQHLLQLSCRYLRDQDDFFLERNIPSKTEHPMSDQEHGTRAARSPSSVAPMSAASTAAPDTAGRILALKKELDPYFELLSSKARKPYEQLLEIALQGAAPKSDPVIEQVRSRVSDLAQVLGLSSSVSLSEKKAAAEPLATSSNSPGSAAASPSAPPARKRGRPVGSKNGSKAPKAGRKSKSSKPKPKPKLSLSIEQADELRIRMLQTYAQAKKDGLDQDGIENRMQELKNAIAKELKLGDDPKVYNRPLGAVWANANGAFRAVFVARVLGRCENEKARQRLLGQLAGFYGVKADTLTQEIEQSK